jgi:hypothetical protein
LGVEKLGNFRPHHVLDAVRNSDSRVVAELDHDLLRRGPCGADECEDAFTEREADGVSSLFSPIAPRSVRCRSGYIRAELHAVHPLAAELGQRSRMHVEHPPDERSDGQRTDALRLSSEHHQIRAPWVISVDGWDGQVLRTPVPVEAAGCPTSQDN